MGPKGYVRSPRPAQVTGVAMELEVEADCVVLSARDPRTRAAVTFTFDRARGWPELRALILRASEGDVLRCMLDADLSASEGRVA
jgi:hypothetical protein